MKNKITSYSQVQSAIEHAIFKLSNDEYTKRWGLEDLYRLSLRGSITHINYIFANCEKLIKYCERKARNYDDLRNYINKKTKQGKIA